MEPHVVMTSLSVWTGWCLHTLCFSAHSDFEYMYHTSSVVKFKCLPGPFWPSVCRINFGQVATWIYESGLGATEHQMKFVWASFGSISLISRFGAFLQQIRSSSGCRLLHTRATEAMTGLNNGWLPDLQQLLCSSICGECIKVALKPDFVYCQAVHRWSRQLCMYQLMNLKLLQLFM